MEAILRAAITEAMKNAMRSHDEMTISTTRMILAKIKDMDIAARPSGNTTGIGDAEISILLQGMIKQRRESIELYQKGNRQDLADKESGEITVIERFMPRQLDATESEAAINAAIAAVGATGIRDMGKVMAELKRDYAGKMDMAKAGESIKKILAEQH